MQINLSEKEELTLLLINLKKKEINYHRLKIVHLSQSIFLHPNKKHLAIKLQNSLKRLDTLLTA